MFRNKKIIIFMTFLAGAILASAAGCNADTIKAPDFSLKSIDNGNTVHLADFKGKVLLINFFSSTCPPCRLEIPDFVKLQEKYGPKGFTVLGISTDPNPAETLPWFIKALDINYPVVIATSQVLRDYGNVYFLPVSFLVGRNQNIVKRYLGMVTEHELEPVLRKALQE